MEEEEEEEDEFEDELEDVPMVDVQVRAFNLKCSSELKTTVFIQ